MFEVIKRKISSALNFESKNNLKYNLIRTEGKLEFRLRGTDEDSKLIFTPHFKQHTQRYGIYWTIVEENSKELETYLLEKQHSEAIKAAEIDCIQVGNDQYELSHYIKGQATEAGDREGFHYRFAKPNGWFSYEMKVDNTEATYLEISYIPGQCKEGFGIYVNDSLLSHELIAGKPWNKLITKTFLLPKELIINTTVTVTFKASALDNTARIVNIIRTTKKV